MPWRLTGREHLDDAHAAAAAWARTLLRGRCLILIGVRAGLAGGSMRGKQLFRLSDILSAVTVGEEAVMADAVEALG
jgi:hypothetical protein